MTVLVIILSVVLGIVVLGALILLFIGKSLKNLIGDSDFNLLKDMLKNKEYETEEDSYSRDKSIGGMTSIYEPQIRADFPDFNLTHLYNNVESNLRSIFNAKTEKDASLLNDEQLLFLKNSVIKEIEDMNQNEITESFKDVSFNQHVIRSYTKKNGTATITTASQVKYYYDTNKKKEKYNHLKKSTIYLCDFIYVYDESKFKKNQITISINCRNCGAPLVGLDGGTCVYCGTYSKPINLRAWKMASYKEDKRN